MPDATSAVLEPPGAPDQSPNLPALLAERNGDAEDRVAKSGFRDPVAYALRSFARADGDGGASFADPGAELKGFDPKTGVARFVITTDAKDRAGDVVKPHGVKAYLHRYEKNPVVFFGHKSAGLPIGSAVDADGRVCLELSEHAIVSPVKFHLKTRESEEVAALVEARELRTASIGFIPLKALVHRKKLRDPDGGDGDDDRPKNETDFLPYTTFSFTEWELYEWSIVAVPMNAECMACRLSKGIGGKPLTEAVRRYLEPFAAPAAAWASGVSLMTEVRDAPSKTRGRKAVAQAVKDQAGRVEALESKIDSLARLVEGVALSVKALADRPAPAAQGNTGLVPSIPPAAVTTGVVAVTPEIPGLKDLLSGLALVKERQEANAAELRRITGRVD